MYLPAAGSRARRSGFTLIELMVVMTIVSLLLSLAAPRYFRSIERSKETVLKAGVPDMPAGMGMDCPMMKKDAKGPAVMKPGAAPTK